MPELPRLFSAFSLSHAGSLDGIRIPVLRMEEALPYATNRPIERLGREDLPLPPGIGVVEIPFGGDIGVFDLRTEGGMEGPPGYTRGQFLRLFVPLDEAGNPNPDAYNRSIRQTERRLEAHRGRIDPAR